MSNLPATHASSSYDPIARATKLIQLFCTPVDQFGILESAGPDEVPQPWRRLLNHQSHMTVAMERFYSAPVRLKVISQCTGTGTADRKPTPADWYAREILLLDPLGKVVQYGVVRLDLRQLNASTLTASRSPASATASSGSGPASSGTFAWRYAAASDVHKH